ncbi:hypothetical protein BCR39DRAFT_274176 [Naematelia encephala]|uniref:Uncharacterized protein n=1 Tax=Naematelia encephala TaxID=71784 RepID=A0A1Y2AU25_9TREE|nr:hypothetical protein BCR39DRAFT_274176 [Naematelia encephala]
MLDTRLRLLGGRCPLSSVTCLVFRWPLIAQPQGHQTMADKQKSFILDILALFKHLRSFLYNRTDEKVTLTSILTFTQLLPVSTSQHGTGVDGKCIYSHSLSLHWTYRQARSSTLIASHPVIIVASNITSRAVCRIHPGWRTGVPQGLATLAC